MSRVCEEFNCLPSAAVRELMNDPLQMALEIMELRAYARTKEQLDNARTPGEAPTGPMVDWIFQVQLELMRRRREGE